MAPTTRSRAATKAKTKTPLTSKRANSPITISKTKKSKPKAKPAGPSTKTKPAKVQKKAADLTKSNSNRPNRARRRRNLRRGLRDGFEYEEAYKVFPSLFRINRRTSTPEPSAFPSAPRRRSLYMDSALTTPMPRSPATPSPPPSAKQFTRCEETSPAGGATQPASTTTAASSPGILLSAMRSPTSHFAANVGAMGFRSPGVRFATPSVPTGTLLGQQSTTSRIRPARTRSFAGQGASPDSRRSSIATTTIAALPAVPAALTAPHARRVSSIAREIAEQALAQPSSPAPWRTREASSPGVAEHARVATLRNQTTLSSSDLIDIGAKLQDVQSDLDNLIEILRSKANIMDVVERRQGRRRVAAARRS